MNNEVSAMGADVNDIAFDSILSELVHQSVVKAQRLGQVRTCMREVDVSQTSSDTYDPFPMRQIAVLDLSAKSKADRGAGE